MNVEQKAIIEAAEKEGLLPMEMCARLVVHDMVKAARAQMSRYEVGYNKMTEKQQDAVLGDLEKAFTDLALTVARTIASGGTPSVIMTLKSMKIDAKSQVTGVVEGNEKYFNELIAKAQDKSEVVLVLYERQYADAMDNIQSDKDQRSLPLDGEKPATKPRGKAKPAADSAKPIEIPPKLLEQARDFVTTQQNANIAALQNQLKIGMEKAIAILERLADEGAVLKIGEGKDVKFELVRSSPATVDGGNTPDPVDFDAVTLTDELYDKLVEKVRETGSATTGALAIAFDLDMELAELAVERMQADSLIDEEGKVIPEKELSME